MWKPSIFANIVAPLYHVLEAQEKEKSFDIAYKFLWTWTLWFNWV